MLKFTNGSYRTTPLRPSIIARILPSLTFYLNLVWIVIRSACVAKFGNYDDEKWGSGSREILARLESIGLQVEVDGLDNIAKVDSPIVFIGNHMSMMETLLLPSLILPFGRVTYVIKDSLLRYPVFQHVMRSRNPIAVTRTNPRQDLKTVLTEGCERLQRGISIIVFPQTTRTESFEPTQMSTIGVKLAQKANAIIIPLAVQTDAWQNGRMLKDFGRINTKKTAYLAFGEPIHVAEKNGKEQEKVNQFISEKIEIWSKNR